MKYVWLALIAILIWLSAYLVFTEIRNKPNNFVSSFLNSTTPTSTPTPAGFFQIKEPVKTIISANKLFQLVNEWRVQNGYQPYIKSDFAENIAKTRLSEVKVEWSHDKFLKHHNDGDYCQKCWLGENLVKGYPTEQESLDNWLNSPSHRANLERNYTHSAIVCDNTVENYCVHIFSYY